MIHTIKSAVWTHIEARGKEGAGVSQGGRGEGEGGGREGKSIKNSCTWTGELERQSSSHLCPFIAAGGGGELAGARSAEFNSVLFCAFHSAEKLADARAPMPLPGSETKGEIGGALTSINFALFGRS